MNALVYIIASAIGLLQPGMSRTTRTAYAKIVDREAKRSKTDPFLLVALIQHESRFNPAVIGGENNQCVGWTQVCVRHLYSCRNGFDSPDCEITKTQLQTPDGNLHYAAGNLLEWKTLCKKMTGRADAVAFLSGFGGYDLKNRTHCGQKKIEKKLKRGKLKTSWKLAPLPKELQVILDNTKHLHRVLHHR